MKINTWTLFHKHTFNKNNFNAFVKFSGSYVKKVQKRMKQKNVRQKIDTFFSVFH